MFVHNIQLVNNIFFILFFFSFLDHLGDTPCFFGCPIVE